MSSEDDCLDCYLDDVVESFQDYVRKSLILLMIGLGSMLVMGLCLMRKTRRQPNCNIVSTGTDPGVTRSNTRYICSNRTATEPRKTKEQKKDTLNRGYTGGGTSTGSYNTDEKFSTNRPLLQSLDPGPTMSSEANLLIRKGNKKNDFVSEEPKCTCPIDRSSEKVIRTHGFSTNNEPNNKRAKNAVPDDNKGTRFIKTSNININIKDLCPPKKQVNKSDSCCSECCAIDKNPKPKTSKGR